MAGAENRNAEFEAKKKNKADDDNKAAQDSLQQRNEEAMQQYAIEPAPIRGDAEREEKKYAERQARRQRESTHNSKAR